MFETGNLDHFHQEAVGVALGDENPPAARWAGAKMGKIWGNYQTIRNPPSCGRFQKSNPRAPLPNYRNTPSPSLRNSVCNIPPSPEIPVSICIMHNRVTGLNLTCWCYPSWLSYVEISSHIQLYKFFFVGFLCMHRYIVYSDINFMSNRLFNTWIMNIFLSFDNRWMQWLFGISVAQTLWTCTIILNQFLPK